MSWADRLGGDVFRFGVFPVAAAVGGLLVKLFMRRVGGKKVRLDDLSIWLELVIGTLLALMSIAIDRVRLDFTGQLTQVAADAVPEFQFRVYFITVMILASFWFVAFLAAVPRLRYRWEVFFGFFIPHVYAAGVVAILFWIAG